jgi:hypothetical protein
VVLLGVDIGVKIMTVRARGIEVMQVTPNRWSRDAAARSRRA